MRMYTDMVDEISKNNLKEVYYNYGIIKKNENKNVVVNVPEIDLYGRKIFDYVVDILKEELIKTYKVNTYKNICVVGLGNREILSDALGPKVLQKLLVTRGLDIHPQLSVIYPNVYAETGIESADFVFSVCGKIKPDLIIFIDAFATESLSRLGASFQITDKGIRAGSAKNNNNKKMTKKELKADTITLGVPMLVYAEKILSTKLKKEVAKDKLSNLILTPCDVKKNLNIVADIISHSINLAVFPQYSEEEIKIILN